MKQLGLLLLLICTNGIFAQVEKKETPRNCLFIGDSLVEVSDVLTQIKNESNLDYLEIEGIVNVVYIADYYGYYLIDVFFDSIINDNRMKTNSSVQYSNNRFTIYSSKCDTDNKGVDTLRIGEKYKLSLRSVRSLNYVGHGENYIHIYNDYINENIDIPFSLINNTLLQSSSIIGLTIIH